MKKENVGIAFFLMAAFLYASYYVSAAIYCSSITYWSAESFQEMLSYIGPSLKVLSILCALIGAIYIGRAEWDEYIRKHGEEKAVHLKEHVKNALENVLSDDDEEK